MTLYSYVVRWDHGFAPNPYYAACTIATCKPPIRKKAKLGDWVLGTGSASRKYQGRAIFLMQVTKITCFDDYWADEQFVGKRPVMNGSLKQRFGDNIYHRDASQNWLQADSRHSWHGHHNDVNLKRDTGTTDRVLIGSHFFYWGELAPKIPDSLKKFVIARRGHEEKYSEADIDKFVTWAKSLGQEGQIGDPLEWRYERYWR